MVVVNTARFAFKQLTRSLKVTPTDPRLQALLKAKIDSTSFKLTMKQWQVFSNDNDNLRLVGDEGDLKPLSLRHRYKLAYSWRPDTFYTALQCRGLIYSPQCTVVTEGRTSYGTSKTMCVTKLLHNVLTELGEALRQEIPKCPDEELWVLPSAKKPRSPQNIRLTKAQRKLITNWTKLESGKPRERSHAVPFGGSERELSHWRSQAKGRGPTYQALLECGCIELGLSGVQLVDGRLTSAGGVPELVYRRTVLGGLIGDE